MQDLHSLYTEIILDHSRHPHHFGEMADATHSAIGYNPICGDELKIFLKIMDNKIQNVQFTGTGCAISLASASLLTDALLNKSIDESLSLFQQFRETMVSDLEPNQTLGNLSVLANIRNYPVRVKCVTLSWHTFKAALENNQKPISTE